MCFWSFVTVCPRCRSGGLLSRLQWTGADEDMVWLAALASGRVRRGKRARLAGLKGFCVLQGTQIKGQTKARLVGVGGLVVSTRPWCGRDSLSWTSSDCGWRRSIGDTLALHEYETSHCCGQKHVPVPHRTFGASSIQLREIVGRCGLGYLAQLCTNRRDYKVLYPE